MSNSEKTIHEESVHYGGILIFIGGILALAFPIFPISWIFLSHAMVGEWFEILGRYVASGGITGVPQMGAFIVMFILVSSVVTIILGALAMVAYTYVRSGSVKEGGRAALVVGVAMIATSHFVPGILTMIGGVLCYSSKKQE
jgi:hypothetical protein